MHHVQINFSPFSTNVLDWVDKDGLTTPSGEPVKVTRSGINFVIRINGAVVYEGMDNTGASYQLNMRQVGLIHA